MEAVRWLAAAPPGASLLLAFSGRSTPLPMPDVGKSQDLSQHPAGGLLPCDYTQVGCLLPCHAALHSRCHSEVSASAESARGLHVFSTGYPAAGHVAAGTQQRACHASGSVTITGQGLHSIRA